MGSWVFLLEPIPAAHRRALTDGRGRHARCQLHLRSSLGFSSLLKDTGIRTSDLPITSRPALPAELQPPPLLKQTELKLFNEIRVFYAQQQPWQINGPISRLTKCSKLKSSFCGLLNDCVQHKNRHLNRSGLKVWNRQVSGPCAEIVLNTVQSSCIVFVCRIKKHCMAHISYPLCVVFSAVFCLPWIRSCFASHPHLSSPFSHLHPFEPPDAVCLCLPLQEVRNKMLACLSFLLHLHLARPSCFLYPPSFCLSRAPPPPSAPIHQS